MDNVYIYIELNESMLVTPFDNNFLLFVHTQKNHITIWNKN